MEMNSPQETTLDFPEGGQEALARLVDANRERFLAMIRFRMDRRLATRIDAEDGLQEAYYEAVKRIDSYEPESCGTPFVWMRTMIFQTLIDLHRRHLGAKMRDVRLELGEHKMIAPQATSMCLAEKFFGKSPSPSGEVMARDMLDKARAAIEKMSNMDQEILAMRHFEELSNKECAEVLGIEAKAASIRYVRALTRLKDLLAGFSAFRLEGMA